MTEDYPTYPIYVVRFGWPDPTVKFDHGMNGTSWEMMLKEKDITEVNRRALNQAERLAEQHNVHPRDVNVEVEYMRMEAWCPGWFSHWTFDTFESDCDVLDSFRQYVWRIIRHNERHKHLQYTKSGAVYEYDDICLMGAEDEWRWTARANGTGIVGYGETTSDAPCRCDGCKKAGVVRIDH